VPGDGATHWGVWLHAVRPLPELAAFARGAEDRGAAAVLVADEGTDRDLFVTLAVLAQATSSALLVAAVTNPYTRHAVATAAAFASVEELAPGRVVAGFGAGGSRVLGPLGLSPARPFTTLVETIDVVDDLLAGTLVDHDGEVTVRATALPWSPGRLPVAIAGRGPRVERLAGARADWVLLAGKATGRVEALARDLRAAGSATRGRPPKLAWNPIVAWTPSMAAEVRSHLAYITVDLPVEDRRRLGVDDDLATRLRGIVTTDGPDAAAPLIPDAVVDEYTIVGDRGTVVDRLADLCRRARPEVVALDASDYSVRFLDECAAVMHDAGVVAGPVGA